MKTPFYECKAGFIVFVHDCNLVIVLEIVQAVQPAG